MDLDVVWTQGRCSGDAHFISNNEICFRTGSFIKICSTDEFSEVSIQGPLGNIECICTDSDLSLIAVKSQSIHVLNYPGFDVITYWKVDKISYIMQMCFSGDNYLLTLEGSPNFDLTFWNWKEAVKLESFQHKFPIEEVTTCFISVHPGLKNILVFQQLDKLHFYEIEDILTEVDFKKKTMYLPVIGDENGQSFLDKQRIETLTYFDSMLHDAWGIHSELMHKFPLKIFCSDLSEPEVVEFYDYLSKHERLQASCHCWLPDTCLLVACSNGTILTVTLDFLIKIIRFSPTEDFDYSNCITGMALSENGLYVAQKNGGIFIVRDIDSWSLTKLISIDETPVRMKFSPDFKNLLFVNCNSSVALLDVMAVNMEISYLSVCQDDSPIIGVFTVNSDFCITAKYSGMIEVLDLNSGVIMSDYTVEDNIKCMVGCPSSSVILISGYSSYIYSIDFSDSKNLKCIQILRPCEKAIEMMKCEPYGRFAVLVSPDPFIFIYDILPSRGFKILGYIPVQYYIKDLALFSEGIQDSTFLTMLGKEDSNDYIMNVEIPGDFDNNYTKYWKDGSGMIFSPLFNIVTIDLKVKCCSLVAHHLKGVILHLPTLNKFINIPLESVKTFSLTSEEESCEIMNDFEACRLFLPSSHNRLLTISDSGDISVRSPENFSILCTHKLSSYPRLVPFCAFSGDLIFIEGCKGVSICLKLPGMAEGEKMPWELFCENKRKEEDTVLSEMKPVTKTELPSFMEQQLQTLSQFKIEELKEKKKELEDKFDRIKKTLGALTEENFSVPDEHQIESEEFVLEENIREQMIKSRSDDIEHYMKVLKEKMAVIDNNTYDMKKECLEDMYTKGKILRSFREGSSLYNYSIPVMSDREKAEICHSYKKSLLEKCLEKVKLEENVKSEDFEKELSFDAIVENEIKEDIGKDFKKQPFQLQSREDRIDYVFTLKYIIFKKRQAFNHLFDEVELLRRSTEVKIKENNSRIKEILLLIREEKTLWEPINTDSDSIFEVHNEEIENSSRLSLTKNSEDNKGLAEEFLKDEWLLKLKASSTQKYHIRLKKDNIDVLKKELDKKFKVIDSMVNDYEKVHAKLVEEKLRWDLEISKDELQIFLILFSVANFSTYKKWEIYNRKVIEDLECECTLYNNKINRLEVSISNSKKEIERLVKESDLLDSEVLQISKASRNKQSFLDAYKKRPAIPETEGIVLNPYRVKEIETSVPTAILANLNDSKNKPARVPMSLWKQLCSLREQKFFIEREIDGKNSKIEEFRCHMKKLNGIQNFLKKSIRERKDNLQDMHEIRIRCNFETPMMLSISHPQLEIKYPDDLDFKESLFFRRFHMEGLNCMISNAGSYKLQAVEQISKAKYQIEKNEAKVRIDRLKVRDATKEIELSKRIPLTKDIQKIILDPKGFNITDKIDALEKSKQMEMNEILKQMTQITKRISNIEVKKDILKRSMKEKKKEIEKLKGDIAELRKIEGLKYSTSK